MKEKKLKKKKKRKKRKSKKRQPGSIPCDAEWSPLITGGRPGKSDCAYDEKRGWLARGGGSSKQPMLQACITKATRIV
jgi:hypothetical protein